MLWTWLNFGLKEKCFCFFYYTFLTGCYYSFFLLFVYLREIIRNYFTVQCLRQIQGDTIYIFPWSWSITNYSPMDFYFLIKTATTTNDRNHVQNFTLLLLRKQSLRGGKDCIICYWLFKFKEDCLFLSFLIQKSKSTMSLSAVGNHYNLYSLNLKHSDFSFETTTTLKYKKTYFHLNNNNKMAKKFSTKICSVECV